VAGHELTAYWSVLLLLLAIGVVGYLVVAARTRHGWHDTQVAALLVGVMLLAAGTGPGLAAWAMHDPRGHLMQHLLIGMYAPLALALSAPVTLLLRATSPGPRRRLTRLLRSRAAHLVGHPLTALALSAGGMYLMYLTGLHAMSHRLPLLQLVLTTHLFASGYLFAWSIAGPDPAPGRPRLWVRVSVLTVSAAAHAYLAKYLYTRPELLAPGPGADLDAARQAAQLMYYGGDVGELALAVALFAGWYRRRSRRAGVSGAGAGRARGTDGSRSASGHSFAFEPAARTAPTGSPRSEPPARW
jgi:putative membrane protein